MNRHARVALVGIAGLALGCSGSEQMTAPTAPRTAPTLAVTASAPSGLPGFRFEEPIVPGPDGKGSGVFDATLLDLLAIEICEWDGSACIGAPVRRITAANGPSEGLRVVPGAEVYRALWHTGPAGLDPTKAYRLRVLASGGELGHADLDILDPSALPGPETPATGAVSVVNGSTLPIAFRIEVGLGKRTGAAGGTVDLGGGDVELAVPAGAVSGDVLLTAVPATNLPSGGPAVVPGTAWDFGPDGIVFTKPVTMTIKYDPALLPPGVAEKELRIHKLVNGTYVQQNAGVVDLVTKTVSAQVDGFSVYVLLQRLFPGSQQDLQGPVIQAVEVFDVASGTFQQATTIDVTAADVSLRTRITMTDDISGVDYFYLYYVSPTGRQVRAQCYNVRTPPSTGSDTNGQWECALQWPRYGETGLWRLNNIQIWDKVGNWVYYTRTTAGFCRYNDLTVCVTPEPQITVASGASDVTPPTVVSFNVSPFLQPRMYAPSITVDVGATFKQIVFGLQMTDDLAGIGATQNDFRFLQVRGPNNQRRQASCSLAQGTALAGLWECILFVPLQAPTGTWIVEFLALGDRVGNGGYFSAPYGSINGSGQLCNRYGTCLNAPTFVVTSTGDATAPLLQSVALTPTNADVATTLGLTDDLTGVTSAQIDYVSTTSGQVQRCFAARTAGTALDGTWSCTVTFSQFAARGQWGLRLFLFDAAGNFRTYTRRASDGWLCYPDASNQPVCQNFGTTDLILQ